MRVAVLTTSYPRYPGDVVGRFVTDAVEHVRRRGIDIDVVGPEQFRGFGLTFGHGVLGNLRRRRPWLALFVPALLASFVRAARRVDADLLHAHWLASGWVAARVGKPYVVQVWGTDVELARRVPAVARGVLRGTRLVLAASTALAESALALGAADVRAHARPVVATAVGGLRDLVVDGENGLVVPPRDTRAFRAALERLLADRELRRRLGAAGRERARRDFSWAAVTDATLAAYSDALGQ
jgi:glycosyltransferase involved in cell wall biosynthesis